jgi:hypothetical protein
MAMENRETTIDLGPQILEAYKTSHIETNLESIPVMAGNLTVDIGQQKIETFRLFIDRTAIITEHTSVKKKSNIYLYPNPVSNLLHIEVPAQPDRTKLKIYNAKGQLLFTRAISNPEVVLDVSPYPNGVYLFSFEERDGISTRKIIINN